MCLQPSRGRQKILYAPCSTVYRVAHRLPSAQAEAIAIAAMVTWLGHVDTWLGHVERDTLHRHRHLHSI